MTRLSPSPRQRGPKEPTFQRARDLLGKYWDKPKPVNLKRLARRMNITLEFVPLDDDLSGLAFIEEGKKYIGVNALHHPNRQRFTIGHEIAHHVLHEELLRRGTHVDAIVLRRDHLSALGTDVQEIEANAFSSELLIPQALLNEKLPDHADVLDDERLIALANEFQVSLTALHFRLTRA